VGRIVEGDNFEVSRALDDGAVNLIYIDPPFNTGREQRHTAVRTERVEDSEADEGDWTGFGGRRYRTTEMGSQAFADAFDDFGLGRCCQLPEQRALEIVREAPMAGEDAAG